MDIGEGMMICTACVFIGMIGTLLAQKLMEDSARRAAIEHDDTPALRKCRELRRELDEEQEKNAKLEKRIRIIEMFEEDPVTLRAEISRLTSVNERLQRRLCDLQNATERLIRINENLKRGLERKAGTEAEAE